MPAPPSRRDRRAARGHGGPIFVVRAATSRSARHRPCARAPGGAPHRLSRSIRGGSGHRWSRGDSNPGLPPCKSGALPAELRPQSLTGLRTEGRGRSGESYPLRPRSCVLSPPGRVGAPGLEPGTSALSGPRSNQLSYAPRRETAPKTKQNRRPHHAVNARPRPGWSPPRKTGLSTRPRHRTPTPW